MNDAADESWQVFFMVSLCEECHSRQVKVLYPRTMSWMGTCVPTVVENVLIISKFSDSPSHTVCFVSTHMLKICHGAWVVGVCGAVVALHMRFKVVCTHCHKAAGSQGNRVMVFDASSHAMPEVLWLQFAQGVWECLLPIVFIPKPLSWEEQLPSRSLSQVCLEV